MMLLHQAICWHLPFSVPKLKVHCTRHDLSSSHNTVTQGSAFFGDFLWRWTKSYPPQPRSERAEKSFGLHPPLPLQDEGGIRGLPASCIDFVFNLELFANSARGLFLDFQPI